MSSIEERPVLWHIPVSHFNEKVRWALDLKGIECERKAPPPGAHMAVALWLTHGRHKTFPLLELDGRAIGDSTEIIAVLEEKFPEPALYPEDPTDLDRALALEDFFDEELGSYARLLAFHELRRDRDGLKAFTASILPARLADDDRILDVAARGTAAFAQVRYRVASDEAAAGARAKILAAFDRLEAELDRGGGDYLVGEDFSVADLTAASLFTPVVDAPEGPDRPPSSAAYREFVDPLRGRRGFQWVERMFARHRQGAVRP